MDTIIDSKRKFCTIKLTFYYFEMVLKKLGIDSDIKIVN